jgi:dephospho-CoA kinase
MNNRHGGNSTRENHSQPSPFEAVKRAVKGDGFWGPYLRALWNGRRHAFSVHLAIFVEPYLSYLLEGQKTVESRFSAVRCPPYRRVQRGDVLLLKLSGGAVVGLCQVGQTWFYRLDPRSWQTIRKEFTHALCAQDPDFWESRQRASFATLMQVENVRRIDPIPWIKRDRRAWVVLRPGYEATLFEDLMANTVLAFSGGIRSGKSTVSTGVAKALGCPRVSFGNYVRTITQLRGLEDCRENWQAVGESLVEEDVNQFCGAVLTQAPWEPGGPLVIDGVRHVEVAQALKSLVSPSGLRLIYIDADDKSRERRLRESCPGGKPLTDLERHSTEVQVKTQLRRLADLVVDGTRPPEELIGQIVAWAEKLS